MSFDAKYANLNTAVSHFDAERIRVSVKRSDGLQAEFTLETGHLDTLLEHLTIVLNSVGYVYVKGLEAIKEGDEI